MAPPSTQLSAPFKSRELNGETLVEELSDLRAAQVHQRHLFDCVLALRDLQGATPAEAAQRLRALASNRFAGQPALGSLLGRWAARVKSGRDVPALVGHLTQLAITSSLVAAVRRANERLPGGGR